MRKLWIFFSVFFLLFILISLFVYVLKKYIFIDNYIQPTHWLMFITPLVLIIGILLPYLYYDRIVKKVKNSIGEEKLKIIYFNLQKIKYLSFLIVAVIVNLNMFLFYKDQFLYMDGIILLFYLLNIPSQERYKNDFMKGEKNKWA